MKKPEEVKPNYGPIYAAALYPKLARIFIDNGYALAVHGSLARDFDLIAVPWGEKPKSPKKILKIITKTFAVSLVGTLTKKKHRRIVQTISIGFGECFIDLSFLPYN